MGLSMRERTGLVGIVLAAGLTAAVAYYHFQTAWALSVGLLVGAAAGTARWAGRWAANRDRFGIRGAVLVAITALLVMELVRELHFSANAIAATARVEEYVPGVRGRGRARVAFQVDGRPVRASLKTRSLRVGDDIQILYLADDPTQVELASIWDRYLSAGVLLLLFGGSTAWELGAFLRHRKPKNERAPETPDAIA
jgi:hypothetical protein